MAAGVLPVCSDPKMAGVLPVKEGGRATVHGRDWAAARRVVRTTPEAEPGYPYLLKLLSYRQTQSQDSPRLAMKHNVPDQRLDPNVHVVPAYHTYALSLIHI